MGMNFATQASSMTGATFFWISLTVTVHSMVSTISSVSYTHLTLPTIRLV